MQRAEISRLLEEGRQSADRELQEVAREAWAGVPPALSEAVGYALSTSGKRIRPILCVAAHRAVGGAEVPAVHRLAAALEIVHTYSLVHDDLPCMDDDDLRRGRPTVHRVYGVATATLAGAALLPLAIRVLDQGARGLGLGAEIRGVLALELCRAAGSAGMVGGQLRDLQAERADIGRAELESIHMAKTGALLAASLRIGAIAAGAATDALAALTSYGEAIGLAFQITDDVLDVVGDQDSLGKTAGRDEHLRKAAYPSLVGLEGARALARSKVDEAKRALAHLPSVELCALADYVVERQT